MAEIFVEQRGHQYVALRDKVIVSTGTTQADTAHRAHRLYPGDVVFGVQFERERSDHLTSGVGFSRCVNNAPESLPAMLSLEKSLPHDAESVMGVVRASDSLQIRSAHRIEVYAYPFLFFRSYIRAKSKSLCMMISNDAFADPPYRCSSVTLSTLSSINRSKIWGSP